MITPLSISALAPAAAAGAASSVALSSIEQCFGCRCAQVVHIEMCMIGFKVSTEDLCSYAALLS